MEIHEWNNKKDTCYLHKGTTFTINSTTLNLNRYIDKLERFLQNSGYIVIKKDKAAQFQLAVKVALEENHQVLNSFEKHKVININPQYPKLYGLIK